MSIASSGSIERGLAVIETLAEARSPLTTSVIARKCGIPRSSLHRLLTGLEARSYVAFDERAKRWSLGQRFSQVAHQTTTSAEALAVLDAFNRDRWHLDDHEIGLRSGLAPDRAKRAARELEQAGWLVAHAQGFSLSPKVSALAGRIRSIERLRAIARGPLTRLRDACGETASLLVRHRNEALYLEQVESQQTLRYSGWVGRSIPIEGTASGAALLDPDGIAHWSRDSVEAGVSAVAAGIRCGDHATAASVIAPTFRLDEGARRRAESAVLAAADEIKRAWHT